MVVAVAAMGGASGGDVTYDGRSLMIGGERKLVFSGSIHYPRSTPDVSSLSHSVCVFLVKRRKSREEKKRQCVRYDFCCYMLLHAPTIKCCTKIKFRICCRHITCSSNYLRR